MDTWLPWRVERSETLQWLFFQVGHVGPMMGQAMFFQRIAKPNGHDVPYAIRRYVRESRRLLEVLNTRLDGRDWLVGDAFSIADMANYTWARAHYWAGIDASGLPGLDAWFQRIDTRPATQAALDLPSPHPQFFGRGDFGDLPASNASRFRGDC